MPLALPVAGLAGRPRLRFASGILAGVAFGGLAVLALARWGGAAEPAAQAAVDVAPLAAAGLGARAAAEPRSADAREPFDAGADADSGELAAPPRQRAPAATAAGRTDRAVAAVARTSAVLGDPAGHAPQLPEAPGVALAPPSTAASSATAEVPDAADAAAPGGLARATAMAAAAEAAALAGGCGDGEHRGTAHVTFTLAPSGRVTQALLDGSSALAGTPVGACVVRAMRAVRASPFEGPPVTLQKTVHVR